MATAASSSPREAVSVPFTLEHNRVLVWAHRAGSPASERGLRVWVDTGNPELWLTAQAARRLGFDPEAPPASPPVPLVVGGLEVPLDAAWPPLVVEGKRLGPGLDADINLPSTLLRRYDLLIDFPARRLRLSLPGRTELPGRRVAARVNRANGLVQVSALVAGIGPCELGVDVGATVSFLSSERFAAAGRHPSWPRFEGAISFANMWGSPDEATWPLLRVPAVWVAGTALRGVVFTSLPAAMMPALEERAAGPLAGLLGGAALLDRTLGISWASESVYFGNRTAGRATDEMDVVALVLRPEGDGRYRVIAVPAAEGRPAVPGVLPGDILAAVDSHPVQGLGMGAVWGLLRGRPGEARRLTIERNDVRIDVAATIRRFLETTRRTQSKE